MMKKRTGVTVLLLMLTLMMVLVSGIPAQAAGKKKKAMKAYRKFLEQSPSDVMWGTVYLNKDSIPDLVTYTSLVPIGKPHVYTYRKNKVVAASYSAASYCYSQYYKKKGVVVGAPIRKGDWEYDFKDYCSIDLKKTASGSYMNVKVIGSWEDGKYFRPDSKAPAGRTQMKKSAFMKMLKKKVGNTKPKKIKY